MGLLWEDRAWDEYLGWQNEDKKTIKKINKLIKDAQRSPSVPVIIVKTDMCRRTGKQILPS